MPRKEFESFTRLDASDVNTYLMDQSVMTFAGTAARGSAIATPVEGMVSYLEDINAISIYDGADWKTSLSPAGGILQVVSTTKTDIFSMTSATPAEITGLTATITPKSTTSKILVMVTLTIGNSGTNLQYIRLFRGSTWISQPDTGASFFGTTIQSNAADVDAQPVALTFLDSPATTSATTYSVRVASNAGTLYINRRGDSANFTGTSTITVMEVSA
jgi:hypothetical protein